MIDPIEHAKQMSERLEAKGAFPVSKEDLEILIQNRTPELNRVLKRLAYLERDWKRCLDQKLEGSESWQSR